MLFKPVPKPPGNAMRFLGLSSRSPFCRFLRPRPKTRRGSGPIRPTCRARKRKRTRPWATRSSSCTFSSPRTGNPRDKRPAIVCFFGGGWTGGTPRQFLPQCKYLATRGMVAIAADYRVASRNHVKAVDCVRDAKSAIRYVRKNAARLGVDPERIVAAGGSAGGHLAAACGTISGLRRAERGRWRQLAAQRHAVVQSGGRVGRRRRTRSRLRAPGDAGRAHGHRTRATSRPTITSRPARRPRPSSTAKPTRPCRTQRSLPSPRR